MRRPQHQLHYGACDSIPVRKFNSNDAFLPVYIDIYKNQWHHRQMVLAGRVARPLNDKTSAFFYFALDGSPPRSKTRNEAVFHKMSSQARPAPFEPEDGANCQKVGLT
jgi:hypothetical protein